MRDDQPDNTGKGSQHTPALQATALDDAWLTLEQIAAACRVEPEWLLMRLEQGLLPDTACMGGVWRFTSISVVRARRMRALERDFEALPDLAALVADLIEERDRLRARLRRAGLE